jgi:molybdenum cofactor cytidylyltransferase
MTRHLLGGVVLAAGLSRRMGTLKPLLLLDGVPAVVRAVTSFTDIGVRPVVVLGHAHPEVAEALQGLQVHCVLNESYRRGMWSSVVCGLHANDASAQWAAVLPADCALVRPETVGTLLRSALKAVQDVVLPTYGVAQGHPPLLSAGLALKAANAEPRGGLRDLLTAEPERVLEVAVDDGGVLLDMDRREHYEAMDRHARDERVPDDRLCERLQEQFHMSASVRAHCATVALVAGVIGVALNDAGCCLNLRLLRSVALLHDVARREPDHAGVGGAWLAKAGYPRMAPIVAGHMEQPTAPTLPGEVETLYLADKLVAGDQIVPLERRMSDMLERYCGDQQATEAARRRLSIAIQILGEVERCTGVPAKVLLRRCEAQSSLDRRVGSLLAIGLTTAGR